MLKHCKHFLPTQVTVHFNNELNGTQEPQKLNLIDQILIHKIGTPMIQTMEN